MTNKKSNKKVLIIALILIMLISLSSCLAILGGIIGGVDTFFNFVDNFGSEALPENVVYGTANDLAVGFNNGNMLAFWDDYYDYDYALDITKNEQTSFYSEREEEHSALFSQGSFDLKTAGYMYSDSLSLKLYVYSEIVSEDPIVTAEYDYHPISATYYAQYAKSVGYGFVTIDYYIASRYELFEFFSYMIIFRPQAKYTRERNDSYYLVDQNILLAYDFLALYDGISEEDAFTYEITCAIAAFEDSAAYNYAYTFNDDSSAEIKLKFYYETDPVSSTNSFSTYSNAVRPGDMPHYTIGENERVFAIDSRSDSVTVASTDQLYFAIKKGYKPSCVAGSNAEYIYNKMRSVLASINKDSTIAPTKVHYIYDYLVNTVVYDYEFVSVTLKQSGENSIGVFAYKCLYMEGVFGFTDKKEFSSANCVAICDGLSKAFLCMTQIEGIDSIKVSGTVNGDAHAWNKVNINSRWYLIDTTWGNKLDGKKEYLSHDYLMVEDDSRHVEDKWYYYPSATGRYHYYFD